MSLAFSVVVCIGLTACAAPQVTNSVADVETTCAIPCWQGITPGITQETQVQAVLSSMNSIEPGSLQHMEDSDDPSRGFYFFSNRLGENYSITVHKGTVTEIGVVKHNLNIETILREFGSPSLTYATRRSNPHSNFDYYEVQLYYPDKGILVTASACVVECNASRFSGDKVYVDSEMGIRSIAYFEPRSSLYDVLTKSLLLQSEQAESVLKHITPWIGTNQYYPSIHE